MRLTGQEDYPLLASAQASVEGQMQNVLFLRDSMRHSFCDVQLKQAMKQERIQYVRKLKLQWI